MTKATQQVNSKMNSKVLIKKASHREMNVEEIKNLTEILLRRYPNSRVVFALKSPNKELFRLLKVSHIKK
jgi:hypothetical protein